ncbi:hypothetical protein HYR99_22020 [Candidatus Poribacteria bacterium]|nr:hypothetical protein [Candidatus Poribacteria bacterium]
MFIMKLMEAIRKGGEEAHEAALALGLLMERGKVRRPAPGDDGGVRGILGETLANRRLSKTELRIAVNELICYITETLEPHPMAVWALTKSHHPHTLPHLIHLLDRVLTHPEHEHLAYQALIGVINIGTTSAHKDLSLTAIQKAAEQGHGQVKETATQYLKMFSKTRTEDGKK